MVTSMFVSLVWSFSQPRLSMENSITKVSAPQLTLVCACVILPWLSPSTAWFWKISSALVFIVVFCLLERRRRRMVGTPGSS